MPNLQEIYATGRPIIRRSAITHLVSELFTDLLRIYLSHCSLIKYHTVASKKFIYIIIKYEIKIVYWYSGPEITWIYIVKFFCQNEFMLWLQHNFLAIHEYIIMHPLCTPPKPLSWQPFNPQTLPPKPPIGPQTQPLYSNLQKKYLYIYAPNLADTCRNQWWVSPFTF